MKMSIEQRVDAMMNAGCELGLAAIDNPAEATMAVAKIARICRALGKTPATKFALAIGVCIVDAVDAVKATAEEDCA